MCMKSGCRVSGEDFARSKITIKASAFIVYAFLQISKSSTIPEETILVKLFEPLPRETGKSYALRVLRENIVDLDLPPGSQISENELSAALNISRTPIREALSELEAIKLVDIVPQKKTSISLIDYSMVDEAYFMRCALETALIDQVCEQRTEEDLLRLEQNLEMQRLFCRSGALKEFKSKDDEFHRAFFEITHKMEIYQLQQKLQAHSDRVRNLSLSIVADEAIIEEHAGIVDCIRKGDAPLAKSRLKLHLQRYQIDAAAIRRAFPQYFKGKS